MTHTELMQRAAKIQNRIIDSLASGNIDIAVSDIYLATRCELGEAREVVNHFMCELGYRPVFTDAECQEVWDV